MFDDSCEEVYNDKEFVKLATAGRHKSLDVIYFKHNLFHQSRCSRTIDLNTSDIIPFKSPLDIQLLDHLGRQLNARNFLKFVWTGYKGQLRISTYRIRSRTSDCLRYCSNKIPPGPSVFNLQFQKAEVTHVTTEREKNIYSATHGTVEFKSTTETTEREKNIYSATHGTVEFKSTTSKTKHKSVVCEYLLILVNSNLPVSIPNPNNVEESYKTLISQKTNLEKKLAVILSKQEFCIIRHILYFCLKCLMTA